MRFVYGAIALILWCILGVYMINQGVDISNDMQILSTAIVVAGAMAGGDDIK
jgi:hypothetical protein